jgi:hypothetical protein
VGTTTITLTAVREQYLGEKVQVNVDVTSMEEITSISIDFGDGYRTVNPATFSGPQLPQAAGTIRSHVYPAAGRYRITATVTVVPGQPAFLPTGPGVPSWMWLATGPEHTVAATAELLQRAELAPPNYPRIPGVIGE